MPATAYRATLEHSESLSYNVRGFRLKLVDPPVMEFKAGQFIIVNVPRERAIVKRAYSVASPPHERGIIELCIQHSEGGAASTYFWNLKEGDELSLAGPHGRFVIKEPIDYEPVFMATGTGIAPMRSMILDLFHRNVSRKIWLLSGSRYEHAILYDSEMRSIAQIRQNLQYIPTVSRPKEWQGETGHIQQTLQKHISNFSDKEIYLCGWLEIVKYIAQDLAKLGIPKEKIHYEEW